MSQPLNLPDRGFDRDGRDQFVRFAMVLATAVILASFVAGGWT